MYVTCVYLLVLYLCHYSPTNRIDVDNVVLPQLTVTQGHPLAGVLASTPVGQVEEDDQTLCFIPSQA